MRLPGGKSSPSRPRPEAAVRSDRSALRAYPAMKGNHKLGDSAVVRVAGTEVREGPAVLTVMEDIASPCVGAAGTLTRLRGVDVCLACQHIFSIISLCVAIINEVVYEYIQAQVPESLVLNIKIKLLCQRD